MNITTSPEKTAMPEKLFLIWDEENCCFEQYFNLDEATDYTAKKIFVADVKLLGTYKKKQVIEKVKERGRPRKK